MASSPKKSPQKITAADTVAPERLTVMRPLVFNRSAGAAPDPKLAQQRALQQASTEALAGAFGGDGADDSGGIDLDALERALKNGANVNAPVNDYGQTALHIAATENDLALAGKLLRHGANTRARDHEGMTPLIRALREDNEAMSGLLARAEQRPEAQVLDGRHALHDAAAKNHVEAIEALIARGVSPTIRDVDGDSPMMEAIKNEALDAAIALAYAGGVRKGTDKECSRPSITTDYDRPDFYIVDFLKEAAAAGPCALPPQPPVLPQKRGLREEELFGLIASRDRDSIPPLLKKRPDLGARNDAGDTPLLAALRRGLFRTAGILAGKSDVKAKGLYAETALHLAAASDATDGQAMVKSLIGLGADVNARDARGRTPLMIAAHHGAEDNALLLLQGGAKPELTDNLGFTAADHAHFAAGNGVGDLLADVEAERKAKLKAKTAFKAAAAKKPAAGKAATKKPAVKKPLQKKSGAGYR